MSFDKYTETCLFHHSQDKEQFHYPKKFACAATL